MRKFAVALWEGKRLFVWAIPVWALGVLLYVYIQLALHGEYTCYEFNQPVAIGETVIVCGLLGYFCYRLVKAWRR